MSKGQAPENGDSPPFLSKDDSKDSVDLEDASACKFYTKKNLFYYLILTAFLSGSFDFVNHKTTGLIVSPEKVKVLHM